MNRTILAMGIQLAIGAAYAAEEPALGEYEAAAEQPAVGGYDAVEQQDAPAPAAPDRS